MDGTGQFFWVLILLHFDILKRTHFLDALLAINYVYVYGRKHAVEFSIIKIVRVWLM